MPPYLLYGFAAPAAGVAAASAYAYRSCLVDVPHTRRRRFLATTPRWEADVGHAQYRALLERYRGAILPDDHRAAATVRRVGGRIAAAARSCSRDWNATTGEGEEGLPPSTPYTYTVVRSPEANAFVLPGNHIFVFTGLFRYARDEDDLASILGHEMAHNLARHAGERASEGLLAGVLGRLALLADPSGILYSVLLPARTLLWSLPHSREHEAEADRIGIILAGEACYDPRAARRVFARMKEDAAGSGGAPPPEFLSTHPGHEARLALFDRWMPEALERFNEDGGNKCRAIRGQMKRARKLAAEMHDGKESRGR